ncbi:sigma-70 family RNA polymerase sigma factor [Massilia antarctica]|uniref:Sigma-70 family RNA polymerase sigma factor n=1 Tax=Massilia antarctica TaxID=2765360 RepID=A0AA48W6S9_9BURK|nr:sigma-70 family RNA polymerase sigma factor [Massilia antarctica]
MWASGSATDNDAGHAGLAHLFKQYRPVLVGFVTRYTGCHEDAEDVVQAAFVRARAAQRRAAPCPHRCSARHCCWRATACGSTHPSRAQDSKPAIWASRWPPYRPAWRRWATWRGG